MTKALIERLIRIIDGELVPSDSNFLSGRLGIIVEGLHGHDDSFIITIASKGNPLLTAERFQALKRALGQDIFKDMDIKLYLDELTEFRDRNLWILKFHIFGKEDEEKKKK